MDDKQINDLVNSFCKNVDDEITLESELNQFSAQVASKLYLQPNSTEAVLDTYRGVAYAFQFFIYLSPNGTKNGIVKFTDLKKYKDALKLSVPEMARVKRADFEIDPDENLEQQVKQVLTLMFFKEYNLNISPEVEEE